MLRILLSLPILLFSSFAQAQSPYTPKKIENNDLRSKKEVISIKFKDQKKLSHYFISKSHMGQFHIEHNENEKFIKSLKMDSENVQKLDDQFVDKFIKMKYMMEKKYSKKCLQTYTLYMHGEDLVVCKADTARMEIVKELISLFKSKLI